MSDTKQLIARYEPRLLRLILLLFVLLGWSYALTTPVFEASDELWHYPLIKFLADGNPLPVQAFDPDEAGPWKQQASQPPLYYWLAAATTFWIDTDDLPQVRWLNPHVDNGIITTDGNINMVVHDPNANPWQGTLLAVRVIRVLSVLLGACTVYLTYRIAREVAPNRPEIALGAAAINAFTPMFLFISGAVNNDNLVVPLASLALWLMIRLVRSEQLAVNSEQLPVISNQLAVSSNQLGVSSERSPIYHLPFTIHHSPFTISLLPQRPSPPHQYPACPFTTASAGIDSRRAMPEAMTAPAPMVTPGSMKMPVPQRTLSPKCTRLDVTTPGPKLQ